ncbi:MAG TPA: hypothetical protein VK573_12405 [Gemmatimonadales bacterium]|nr:hypothetical protein [Gemmatimonadales bacterium]
MSQRPRWVDLTSILLGLAVLSILGKYYHQWVIGVLSAIAAAGLVQFLYFVTQRTKASSTQRHTASQHAVVVHLSPSASAAVGHEEDLDTLETLLRDVIDAQELGEYDGNEIGAGGAVLYMYGEDGERLFRAVEPTLRASRLCSNARVLIRPGPPGTPSREIRL